MTPVGYPQFEEKNEDCVFLVPEGREGRIGRGKGTLG
jgi:hypothetical protein